MATDREKYKYELGERSFREAQGAASAAVPLGRTPDQIARAKSGAAASAESGLGQAQAGLARNLGGTTSPLYAMLAARMRTGASAQASGAALDIDAQEAQRNQEMEMARRGQMLGAGQLGLGFSQLTAQTGLGAERNAMEQQQINNQWSLGQRGMAVNEQQAALGAELGRGDLALRTELGRGNLSLGNRSLGAQTGLGYAGLAQRQQESQMQFALGQQQMAQRQEQADRAFLLALGGSWGDL